MRIVFMGTPDFAVPSLEKLYGEGHQIALVVTQPDRPVGRKKKLTPPPVKTAALNLDIPLIQPEKLSHPEAIEAMRQTRPDAIALVAFGALLRKEVLELPELGCINAHASLLPKYRGAAPVQWAIAEGEKVTGITTMKMDQGLDTGDILLKEEVEIRQDDTGGSLHDRLAPVAGELLVKTLAGLERGGITPQPQDDREATYAPQLRKSDGKIDWDMPAEKIALRVRAFHPWPGTFTEVSGDNMKVMWAEVLDKSTEGKSPGEVIKCGREGITVACGEGAILITRLQPPGKRDMDVCEWLSGHCLDTGTMLG